MSHRIDWQREKRRILLPISVLAPYPITNLTGVDAKALTDTGSSVSGISSAIAHKLGLAGLGKRPLKSAQGEGQVERYAFRVALPLAEHTGSSHLPFVFQEVIGIELSGTLEFDSLLGMDILGQCDLHIERTGHCSLTFD
jgi:hypothetical protein